MRKKRVIITGSNGFLGQKIAEELSRTEDVVLLCTSRSENRNPKIAERDFVILDLMAEFNRLHEIIEHFLPTHIIHTAALTSVEQCENNKKICQHMNVDVVAQLAQICKRQRIHLIHYSTDFVFDGLTGNYKEEDTPRPLNYYGQSKLESEQKIIISGCKYTIFRVALVYGVIADHSRSNIVLWAKNSLCANRRIKVVNDHLRTPTWVDDIAKVSSQIVQECQTGIFHISSRQLYSIYELVQLVAQFWKLNHSLIEPIQAIDIKQDKNRPAKTGFDLSKAERELNFRPTDLKDSFAAIDLQLASYKYDDR